MRNSSPKLTVFKLCSTYTSEEKQPAGALVHFDLGIDTATPIVILTPLKGGLKNKNGRSPSKKKMGEALRSTSLLSPSGGLEILGGWVFVLDVTRGVEA